ncbi:MAG: BMP family ABC transporter substrate-binding protein [Oscillospiraceae bacterium]|nr:BMP family ABC transporter substrate-binding protein [Oscillospiraceae bacterium]
MKRLISILLAIVLVISLLSALPISAEESAPMKVALIADAGGPEDGGFNQQVHEAAKAWCEAKGVAYAAYTFEDSYNTEVENYGVPIVEQAIAEGATVLLLPGFSFTEPTAKTCEAHPGVTYILLDVDAYSLQEAAGGEEWEIPANVYTATYREEQSAFLAGWAAVAMGYRKLGFLGGPEFPAIIRFGYGFIQGANDAAKALDCTDDVTIRYVYSGQFMPTAEITSVVDGWYKGGVEVVFACGGGIYASAAEAAAANGGKIIGVDADQKGQIDGEFGEGITITSAMKNMGATVVLQLDKLTDGTFVGGGEELNGIVSADPDKNPIGLAPSTVYNETFTEADYAALLKKIVDGELTISDDWTQRPQTAIDVFYQCYVACDYGEPTYVWAADNSSVTAKRVCKTDDSHYESETVKTVVRTTEPTCTVAGELFYTATFENPAFTTQTKSVTVDPKGHVAGNPVKENEVAPTCTAVGSYDAVVYCAVCSAELSRERTEIAALGHDYLHAVTMPTCTEAGYTTHTCSRCGDSYVSDETAALGHDWGEPNYEWADDNSAATATRICKTDASHIETETVKTTSKVTKEATYEAEGEIVYTAVFAEPAFGTQTKKVATPKLEKPPVVENPFNDVKVEAYYGSAVLWAVGATPQITAGTSATTFSPDATCTRAQVVTFLWRAKGCPEPKSTNNPFKDVKEGEYYYKAVLWAVENEITAGTSTTTFSPNAGCTRAQVVTFLWRTEEKPQPTSSNNPFKDVKSGYFFDAVLWAVGMEITAGTSATTFSPDATCTRGQIVTFLFRAFAE